MQAEGDGDHSKGKSADGRSRPVSAKGDRRMGKIFFIADTHFGHAEIIGYENRPFADVGEMDEAIIRNWNETVTEADTVFVVGDFSVYTKEKTTEILGRLKGHKRLVMGNHDTESEQFYMDCGFEGVSRYPVIYDGFWILSHEPMYINSNMPYANIFGHVHANPIYSDYSAQSFCVCCERINYTPIAFEEIRDKIKEEIKRNAGAAAQGRAESICVNGGLQ